MTLPPAGMTPLSAAVDGGAFEVVPAVWIADAPPRPWRGQLSQSPPSRSWLRWLITLAPAATAIYLSASGR
jgi:hypothetical protein